MRRINLLNLPLSFVTFILPRHVQSAYLRRTRGRSRFPAGWLGPRKQNEIAKSKSDPVLSSIPLITSPVLIGIKVAESGGAKGSPPGIVVFSEQATELAKGLRWVGVERGQGGDPPPSITSNSGAESERRDGIGRTQSHPPEICLLVSVGRRIKGVIAICRFFEGSGEKELYH